MELNNLLIIAGTGTKSGKTTFACKLIEQINNPDLVAIKITPHFHETTPGLLPFYIGEGYSIYKEENRNSDKDTSRMLRSGASEVYFAKVSDKTLLPAFNRIFDALPVNSPIVCESPALRYFIDPGLFVIMSSESVVKNKDVSNLLNLPHLKYKVEELESIQKLPVKFSNGRWVNEE